MIAVLWVIAVASVILNVVLFRMLDRSVGHRDDAVRLWKLSIKAARAAEVKEARSKLDTLGGWSP